MAEERMLLVDDDADIRTIAKMTLEVLGGWQVQCACSGTEALRVAQQTTPDVIVLDVMMPGMDGPDTARQLRQLPGLSAVPIIFMTAKAQKHEIQRLLAVGARAVITKPFDPVALPQTIRDALHAPPRMELDCTL
ncbi:MAG: response regulator [Polyangiales bacterium]